MKIETVHRCGSVAPTWGDEQQAYPSKWFEIALKDVADNAAILSKGIARAPVSTLRPRQFWNVSIGTDGLQIILHRRLHWQDVQRCGCASLATLHVRLTADASQ